MWHTSEIIKIMIDIAENYGYDVFQNRKKCVALCGDLFVSYAKEKSVFQMLFHAGLGEMLEGIPYRSEQELRIGLLKIEKFLRQQEIAEDARQCVLEIIQQAFIDTKVGSLVSLFKPVIVKKFDDISFKITIPEITDFADRMDFKFNYLRGKNADNENEDVLLEKCVLTDRLHKVFASHMGYVLLGKHAKGKQPTISIQHENKKIMLTEAKVEFTFLSSNRQRFVIVYKGNLNKKLTFQHIEIYRMSEEEMKKASSIITMLIKAGESGGSLIAPTLPQINQDPVYTSPSIIEYSDALRKEILFLRQGKGKKYKVVNGSKINKDKGIFTYSFELETELHLPDDAPVVIETTAGIRAAGTVLLCEDFQILLLVDRDLNDKVNVAYLMVEPWKLLEALNEKINDLNPNINKLAIELMENGPKLSTNEEISKVKKGQDAVITQLETGNILSVWGPPGTGKTYTMAKIANKYLKLGKSVLIVSHSNVSVDGVIKKTVDMIDTDMASLLKNGKILRFGYVRDEELSKNPYATSFNYALSKSPDLARDLDRYTKKRDELKVKKQTKTAEYDEAEKRIKKIREEIRKEERLYVDKAQLLGTTISRATIDPMFDNRKYDLVMFDEVSMAYVPQVIVAAALAKEKFMFVGDFRQLAPISQSPNAKGVLQTDIFSYLQIVDSVGNMYYHPWLIMLNEQRRMHPDIASFPNKYVYKNLLLNHSSVIHNRDNIVASNPLSGNALNLIDLGGTYCASSKNSDNSRFNILSAIISFATAVSAEKAGAQKIGIITPYAAQTRLIRAMIRDYYELGTEKVSCATVHQFQGSESDVLVFDAVESYPGNKVGFLMGKVQSEVVRLINVAVTRAKGKLITVANARFWENSFKGTNHIFYRLLKHIKSGHGVLDQNTKTLKPYVESISPQKMINIFTDESMAISAFEKDMKKATGKIVVSIPDGELRETHGQVLNIIEEVDEKGIDIMMKSNDYQSLPEGWKHYCWGTENAVFPLIVIDDEVAWYGLPTSKLKFKIDKTTTQITVLHFMVRIKGKNTIEMIKSLANLEMVEIGNNAKPLAKKKDGFGKVIGDVDHQMKSRGLAAFVEEKEFCPECKSHMMLVKNRKGTSYIKCSNKNCTHTDYLKPELMNWYIRSRNVTCPKHDGGEIKGILGKFGPCVMCDRGHFMKPEEI